MTKRDWKHFKWSMANFFFPGEMGDSYHEGIKWGAEYASRKVAHALRNMDVSELTKTQRIGHEKAVEASVAIRKEIDIRVGNL